MIKYLIISFNPIFVFLLGFFFGDTPVSIIGSFPKSVKPATEFIAEILVKKGTISGFAKYQIEVPQGFTVKELESKGGNFSFANNVGKIIWTSVPSEEEFTIKIILLTESNVSGLKTIGSKFSYINNNIKEVIEMNPVDIMIGDGTSQPDSLSVVNTPTTVNTPSTPLTPSVTSINTVPEVPLTATVAPSLNDNTSEPPSNVKCEREIVKGSSEGQFIVNVKIKKGNIKGFAKFQETLPVGYTAKGDKTNGSSFSVSDGKAKFVWVSLPESEELLISYFLEKGKTAKPDAKLTGEFSYLENNQTKKINLSNDFIKANSSVVSINTKPEITDSEQNIAKNQTESEKKEVDKKEEKQASEISNLKNGNIRYNVQIGAFKNDISSDVLARKFKVKETIKSEMAESYHKFMIGNYNEYKTAKTNREEMKQKGCKSAFVVAYNESKRITVQEALMITSQKWFK